MQICYIKPKKTTWSEVEFLKKHLKRELRPYKEDLTKMKCLSAVLLFSLCQINTQAQSMSSWEDGVESKGMQIYHVFEITMRYVCLAAASYDLIKGVRKQDVMGIVQTVVKYGVMYGLARNLPAIFDLIADFFDFS